MKRRAAVSPLGPGATLARDLEFGLAADRASLPWWAYRSTAPAAAPDCFLYREPRRLVTVDQFEQPTAETFRRSNLLCHRLIALRASGELIVSFSWTGARIGPRGLFLLNTAVLRGILPSGARPGPFALGR